MTILGSLLLAALTALCASVSFAADPADIVFTGGKVYTVNEKQPWAEAVAVKGNKIVYVGDNAGAKQFVGKDTKQTDLVGRVCC